MHPPAPDAPRAIAYAYPWTLREEGAEAAFDTLVECGMDGVQLALAYHLATYLSPRAQRGPVRVGDLGALHVGAADALAGAWPLRPPEARDAFDAAALAEVLSVAAARGVRVIAWVVYLYTHALARSRPDLAVRDLSGVASGAHLCPAHPTVRAYARTLTRAVLAAGAFAGFHAEALDFMPYGHGALGAKAALTPGRRARALLGLCLCRHCREAAQRAGVAIHDFVPAAQAWLREHLNGLPDAVAEGADEPWPPDAFGGALDRLAAVRRERVVSLQGEVLARAAAAGARVGSSTADASAADADAATVRATRALVGEVRVRVAAGADVAELRAAAARARQGTAEGVPVYASYALGDYRSEGSFVATVERAAEVGLRHHRFYEYSLWSQRQLAWLRAAKGVWGAS